MDVIIDSTVLKDNYFLDTPKFDALFLYLTKTRSKLFIPRIVLDETINNYLNQYSSTLEEFKKQERILRAGLLNDKNVNLASVKSSYQHSLGIKKVLHKIELIEYFDLQILIESMVNKSLKSQLPFHSTQKYKDIGFRDFIVWRSIISILENRSKNICFISNDKKAFGTSEHLHLELIKEIKKLNVNLCFHDELSEFLSKYVERVNFINDKLILDYIFSIGQDVSQKYISANDIIRNGDIKDKSIDPLDLENVIFNSANIVDYYIFKATEKYYFIFVRINFILIGFFTDQLTNTVMEDNFFSNESEILIPLSFILRIDKNVKEITNSKLVK